MSDPIHRPAPAGLVGLTRDLRVAARSLRRAPGFAAIVVLTLALGIGGTTAVFSVVEAVLLQPLPYEEPGQLVRYYQLDIEATQLEKKYVSGPHFRELRTRSSTLEDVAALYTYSELGVDLAEGGAAERLRALPVSSDYFRVLRAPPVLGRAFTPEEEDGQSRSVVVSHELWQGRFAGDPGILGKTVRLSADPHAVVGVAPPALEDPLVGPVDVWVTMDLHGRGAEQVQNYHLSTVGRLRNGVAIEQARAELASLNDALAEQWPEAASHPLAVYPLREDLVGGTRATLGVLLLAVGLVLLIACVNVANLFLVRSTGRQREFAVRSALGSGGVRIARQLLVESLLLAVLGGALGLAIASFGVDGLKALGEAGIPRLADVGFNPTVLAFAAGVTLLTGVAFGVAPALRFAGTQPSRVLREQGRSATATRAQGRFRSALATAQLALALVLLAGAGVLTASFQRLSTVDLGFRSDRVLAFEVNLPFVRYGAAARAAFHEDLAERLSALPGVVAAGATSRLPATGTYHSWTTYAETGPLAADAERGRVEPEQRVVAGDFFQVLGIPLLEGRVFDARDAPTEGEEESAAVVSRTVAETLFPGTSALGQRIRMAGQTRTIIGVVEDVALDPQGGRTGAVYHAHRQFAANRNWALAQVVATSVPPARLLPAVRAELAAMDPELVLHRPATLREIVGRGVARERFTLLLMGAFAAVALGLAALGLYGVLAYTVRQRTQEIGIRIALGASGSQVSRLVLRQAAAVAGIGVAVGLLGALALGRWLSSLVFQTDPSDPLILAATSLLLTAVALLAAWLPARRAARVEPRLAMQEE